MLCAHVSASAVSNFRCIIRQNLNARLSALSDENNICLDCYVANTNDKQFIRELMGHCFSHGHSTFLKRHQIYCILCESFQYAPVEIPNKVYFREQTICKIGLLNMGSTCFMNSILHVLINSPVLQLASQFRNCSTSSCKLVTRFDEVKDTSSLVEANFNR